MNGFDNVSGDKSHTPGILRKQQRIFLGITCQPVSVYTRSAGFYGCCALAVMSHLPSHAFRPLPSPSTTLYKHIVDIVLTYRRHPSLIFTSRAIQFRAIANTGA